MTAEEKTRQPTRLQAFIINWFIATFLIGVAVPIGITVLFYVGLGAGGAEAVTHGELFLAAGNAVVASACVLLASGREQMLWPAIACLVVFIMIAVPGYALWALFATRSTLGETYNQNTAVDVGWVWVASGLAASIGFVWFSVNLQEHTETGPGANNG